MKKCTFLLILFVSVSLYGQEELNSHRRLEIGGVLHFNSFNEDNYLSSKSPGSLDDNRIMTGLDLRFVIPTKLDYLDLTIGTLFEADWSSYLGTTDYKLNGGGVYAGLSPRFGGKSFGVTGLFAVGVFSYKEYYSYYSETTTPVTDIYEKKASYGLGAMSSLGLYARVGPVGVNPQVQAVFSGGSSSSFLFCGFVLPLTIQF